MAKRKSGNKTKPEEKNEQNQVQENENGQANVEQEQNIIESAENAQSEVDQGQGTQYHGRRQQFQDIARRRAAHFATFEADDQLFEEDNVHVGGNEAARLGPWSSAYELVNQRDEQAKKRQQRLRQQEVVKAKQQAFDIQWQPQPKKKKTIQTRVPSFQDILTKKVAELVDYVESFEGFPDSLKIKIADQCCQRMTMSFQAALLFAQDQPKDLKLNNCTYLEQNQIVQVLQTGITPNLESLELGYCGRGMKDSVIDSLITNLQNQNITILPSLTKIKLFGAYKLGDSALAKFLKLFPNLQDLNIGQGSRLTGNILEELVQNNQNLQNLNMFQCRGLNGSQIAEHVSQLCHLKSLDITGINEADDNCIDVIVSNCKELVELRIGQSNARGDLSLIQIADNCPKLKTLVLDDLHKVSDEGLQALVDKGLKLQELSLFNCQKISEELIIALLSNSQFINVNLSRTNITDATLIAIIKHSKDSLVSLNLTSCRQITDQGLGYLVDVCTELRQLCVFGCSQLTDTFFKGHRNEHLQIIGAYTEGHNLN